MKLKKDIYDAAHVVCDIETLGTEPNAVVLSIAFTQVLFSIGDDAFVIPRRDDAKFFINASGTVGSQILKGRTICQETLAFWRHPDRAVLLETMLDGPDRRWVRLDSVRAHVLKVLRKIRDYNAGKMFLWGFGATFDCSILQSFLGSCADDVLDFRKLACERTLTSLFETERIRSAVPHDALADSVAQATTLANILNDLHRISKTT